MHSDSPLLRPH